MKKSRIKSIVENPNKINKLNYEFIITNGINKIRLSLKCTSLAIITNDNIEYYSWIEKVNIDNNSIYLDNNLEIKLKNIRFLISYY